MMVGKTPSGPPEGGGDGGMGATRTKAPFAGGVGASGGDI